MPSAKIFAIERNRLDSARPGVSLGGVDRMRLELITNALKGRCSTIELPVPLCQSLPCTRRGGWMTQHT